MREPDFLRTQRDYDWAGRDRRMRDAQAHPLALDHDKGWIDRRHPPLDQVHVTDKSRHPSRSWPLIDRRRLANLRELALVHHTDSIRDRHRLVLVVRDDDERRLQPALQLFELKARFLAQLAIERRERLIEQQHLWPLRKRARERNALALATGELIRLACCEWPKLHEARQSILPEPERHVCRDRHVRKQRVALKHHVDRPPVGRDAGEVLSGERHMARVRRFEARKQTQQRGLPAAGGPEQREEFSFVNIERKAIHGGEIAEALGDPIEADERRHGGTLIIFAGVAKPVAQPSACGASAFGASGGAVISFCMGSKKSLRGSGP